MPSRLGSSLALARLRGQEPRDERAELIGAGAVSGDLSESVLDTYEVERKPHARELIRLAKLIGVSMTQGGRAGDVLRRVIAPRLHWIPGLRERLLDGETPPLHPSALVEGHGHRKSLNGRLCPNALLADGARYDDVTRGGHDVAELCAAAPKFLAGAR